MNPQNNPIQISIVHSFYKKRKGLDFPHPFLFIRKW